MTASAAALLPPAVGAAPAADGPRRRARKLDQSRKAIRSAGPIRHRAPASRRIRESERPGSARTRSVATRSTISGCVQQPAEPHDFVGNPPAPRTRAGWHSIWARRRHSTAMAGGTGVPSADDARSPSPGTSGRPRRWPWLHPHPCEAPQDHPALNGSRAGLQRRHLDGSRVSRCPGRFPGSPPRFSGADMMLAAARMFRPFRHAVVRYDVGARQTPGRPSRSVPSSIAGRTGIRGKWKSCPADAPRKP